VPSRQTQRNFIERKDHFPRSPEAFIGPSADAEKNACRRARSIETAKGLSEKSRGVEMDIGAVVVVLVLMALSLAAVMWMEINAGKTGYEQRSRDGTTLGLNEE